MEKQNAMNIVLYIKDNYFLKDYDNNNLINDEDKKSNIDNDSNIAFYEKYEGNSSSIIFESFKERIIIRIPTKNFIFSKAKQLLDDLTDKFKIENYSIVKNQLEDVFINTISNKIVGNNKEYTV